MNSEQIHKEQVFNSINQIEGFFSSSPSVKAQFQDWPQNELDRFLSLIKCFLKAVDIPQIERDNSIYLSWFLGEGGLGKIYFSEYVGNLLVQNIKGISFIREVPDDSVHKFLAHILTRQCTDNVKGSIVFVDEAPSFLANQLDSAKNVLQKQKWLTYWNRENSFIPIRPILFLFTGNSALPDPALMSRFCLLNFPKLTWRGLCLYIDEQMSTFSFPEHSDLNEKGEIELLKGYVASYSEEKLNYREMQKDIEAAQLCWNRGKTLRNRWVAGTSQFSYYS